MLFIPRDKTVSQVTSQQYISEIRKTTVLSYDLGNNKESVEMLQRSLDLRTSILGTDHPSTYEVQIAYPFNFK